MAEKSAPESPGETEDFADLATGRSGGILREFWEFLSYSKKWWLAPIIVALLLLAVFVFLGSTAIAPWIYTLF